MIFCKNWKRWSVSCYTDRLSANQIAGKPVRISCHIIINIYPIIYYPSGRIQVFFASIFILLLLCCTLKKSDECKTFQLRYQASIALQGFFLVPSTFTCKKSRKNVKSIKNVIISNLISLYKHMLKIRDSFSFNSP